MNTQEPTPEKELEIKFITLLEEIQESEKYNC